MQKTDTILMRNATAVAIASITLLILMAAALSYQQEQARNITKGLLVHTYEVTGHIQLLFNRLKDVELGQRGYLIAGNEEYLRPYYDALKDSIGEDAKSDRLEQHHSLAEELGILRKLTKDDPVQQQNLDEMADDVKDLLDAWSRAIAARQQKGASALPLADDGFARNNQLMEHVHRLVNIMMAEENHLLEQRGDADEASSRHSTFLTFTGLLIFYAVMVLSVWLYQRGRLRYTRALEQNKIQLQMQQEELQVSNEELEEKTSALEEQNAHIQQQSKELTASTRLIEDKVRALERANQYKSEFLANMSHELRTPLNSLLILANLLASNDEGNLTAEQVEEAQVIHNGGMELLALINDILDLSKVEAGKLSFTIEECYLEDIVASIRQQFTPIAKQAKVDFIVEVEENLPATLRTDAQRTEQIIKNLLSNAFKFTEQGSVTLKVARPADSPPFQHAALNHSETIAFSVTDTGIGIDPTKFGDIFEAFQQEDGSIDRHYGGTGLGLTIARKFAHRLGGEIQVASEKNKGSTFTLLLPTTPPAANPGDDTYDTISPTARAG